MYAKLAGAFFILAVAGVLPAHADQAAHSCMITIDVSRWSPGACTVEEEGKALTVKWPGAGTIKYLARLEISGNDADASWSTTRGNTTDTQALGSMSKTGDCWSNDKAEICFAIDAPAVADQGVDDPYVDEGSDDEGIQPIQPMSDSEEWARQGWITNHPGADRRELDRSERALLGIIAEIKKLPNDDTASARIDSLEGQIQDEIRGLDEYRMAENAILDKRQAIWKSTVAQRAREAELKHVQDVKNLSLPQEYLDATIILETPFGNERWITMRQWLSRLFANGYHVETVSSYDIGAQGISLKKQDSRSQALFFEQEGNELYLSYAGEGGNVHPLSLDERQKLWLPLKLTVK